MFGSLTEDGRIVLSLSLSLSLSEILHLVTLVANLIFSHEHGCSDWRRRIASLCTDPHTRHDRTDGTSRDETESDSYALGGRGKLMLSGRSERCLRGTTRGYVSSVVTMT